MGSLRNKICIITLCVHVCVHGDVSVCMGGGGACICWIVGVKIVSFEQYRVASDYISTFLLFLGLTVHLRWDSKLMDRQMVKGTVENRTGIVWSGPL